MTDEYLSKMHDVYLEDAPVTEAPDPDSAVDAIRDEEVQNG